MSKFNKEAIQDIFDAGRESVGNALRGPALRVIAVAGGIALVLSGCTVNAEPVPTKTPVAIETEIPVNHQTCLEYATELKATQPQPGSAEWNQYVSEISVPYIEGQSNGEVLSAFVHASVDSLASGVQDLPTDIETLKDCRDQLKEITGEVAPDTTTGGNALDTILGIGWRADAAAEAFIDPTIALGPQEASDRKTIFLSISYQTMMARLANELGDLEPDFVIHDESARLDQTDSGTVQGSIDVTKKLVGRSDDFSIGGQLSPINGHWIAVGKDY